MPNEPLDPGPIGFRPLAHADLPLMHRWLNEGASAEWWSKEPKTPAQVTAEFAPMIDGEDPTRGFVIRYGDEPIGFIQVYYVRHEADYWGHMGFPDDTAGVDLFIGEATYLHRGLGPPLLRRFLREIVFADPSINRCIIDPDPANNIAIRAYERVGFRYLETIGPPKHVEPAYLMVLERGGPYPTIERGRHPQPALSSERRAR